MIEELVILLHIGKQVVVRRGVGIEQLAQPHHAQIPLHRGREAHPVVGAEGHFVVSAVLDGGNALPGGIVLHGGVDALRGEDHHIRVPCEDLLHADLIAGTLGGGLVHLGQVIGQHVQNLGVIGALGNDILAHVTGDIEHIGLFHAGDNGLGAAVDLLAVGGQGLGLGLHAQEVTQHPIGLGIGLHIGADVYEGDAGLLLQGIHVLLDAALALAHINDHLGAALKQGLQVQLPLAAVKLPDLGHIEILFVQELLGLAAPGIGNAHQLIRAQGKQNDLGQRAAEGHLVDLGGDLYLPACGVGENARGIGVCLRGLAAAGGQAEDYHHSQQQRRELLCFHLSFSFFIL